MLLRLSLLFLLLWGVPARADYLAELQQQARQRGLATDPMWLNLLHYKRQPVTGQWRSLADDRHFLTHRKAIPIRRRSWMQRSLRFIPISKNPTSNRIRSAVLLRVFAGCSKR
jgi:hypothetical protein